MKEEQKHGWGIYSHTESQVTLYHEDKEEMPTYIPESRFEEIKAEADRMGIINTTLYILVIDLQASLRAINTDAILKHADDVRKMIEDIQK